MQQLEPEESPADCVGSNSHIVLANVMEGHQTCSGCGSFSWQRTECLWTPAELRWAPSQLIGAEEMMRHLPSQGHPMLQ